MNKNIIAIALASSMFLTACGEKSDGVPYANSNQSSEVSTQQTPAATQAQQPVVQNQQSSILPALAAGAIGYMLGSNSNKQQPQVITREVVREVPTRSYNGVDSRVQQVKPSVPATPKFTAPVVLKPVAPVVAPVQQKPNYSQGGYGSVRQSAPTYRSPSFSSPVRSGRR